MKQNAGFSLLEVLIAFAVMALVLSALIPGQALLMAGTSTAKDELLAYDYALSRLSQLGIAEPIEIGQTEDIYENWNVRIETEKTESPDPNVSLVMITGTISNASGSVLATARTVKVLQ